MSQMNSLIRVLLFMGFLVEGYQRSFVQDIIGGDNRGVTCQPAHDSDKRENAISSNKFLFSFASDKRECAISSNKFPFSLHERFAYERSSQHVLS